MLITLGEKKQIHMLDKQLVVCSVTKIENDIDVIFLTPDTTVEVEAISLCLPYLEQTYIALGFSSKAQSNSPLTISRGVITDITNDIRLHIPGSQASSSGGCCFDFKTGQLIGMFAGIDPPKIVCSFLFYRGL